ncbi:MAG: ATP-binding protein [Acidobacteriota bacterium]|nr:ATP-binding protein [Acidobacteriota bacterium]
MDYEKLGVFYLGRPYDMAAKENQEGLILYDSKNLTTHGVCVGMTGSGKTGLCIALLEEAAIDGIPAIVIDPKGDMPNLLLTFPELQPEDFRPWINEDDARKKGMTPDDFARNQADLWRKGLATWQQDGERIRRLRQAADFAVYTPGSTAGLPVSILKSFAAPSAAVIEDEEILRDRITSTASSLLGLIKVDADPIRSREHILISTILNEAWRHGRDLSLEGLIHGIQTPPVQQVGVMNLESFFPSKDRFSLALQLNNLLAAPGFSAWLQGESLDIGSLLYTPSGKPRIAVFSIAHLGDAERMFFVSLLLNQILSWTRSQPGTSSLRALVYMDEIFGFFPPVANPPSKAPMLTLLKQARAHGVGILLTTQNPVDLDYKGLSNTGTWLIGRLQTERDKMRVLDGLEGVAASQSSRFDRKGMEQTLAGLGSRVFLMHNVHDDGPSIFQTRWCMSYLRGPMTRNQIKVLMDEKRAATATADSKAQETLQAPPVSAQAATASTASAKPLSSIHDAQAMTASAPTGTPPARTPAAPPMDRKIRLMLPPDIKQFFIPVRGPLGHGETLVYEPRVLANAQIGFSHPKTGIRTVREEILAAPVTAEPLPVNWHKAFKIEFPLTDLKKPPADQAAFMDVPSIAASPRNYDVWARELADWLYRNQSIKIFHSADFKLASEPGESERDFRIRLQQSAREQRDALLDALRKKYATRLATLQDRVRRAEQTVDTRARQAGQQKVQTMISLGSTVLSSILGRKAVSMSTVGRATTAARGAGRYSRDKQSITAAKENLEILRGRLHDLESSIEAEADALATRTDPMTKELETLEVRPFRKNIAVPLIALAWMPYRKSADGFAFPAWE